MLAHEFGDAVRRDLGGEGGGGRNRQVEVFSLAFVA